MQGQGWFVTPTRIARDGVIGQRQGPTTVLDAAAVRICRVVGDGGVAHRGCASVVDAGAIRVCNIVSDGGSTNRECTGVVDANAIIIGYVADRAVIGDRV